MTISAGDNGPRLIVHTQVINTSSSHFLKAVLSNNWKEALEKNIVLHEVDQTNLERYIHWLYTGSITPKPMIDVTYIAIFELFLLGDYLQDMKSCQQLANLIIAKRSCGFPPMQPDICFAWERTLPSSRLRRVITELWRASSVEWSMRNFRSQESPYPMDFVLDMFYGFAER